MKFNTPILLFLLLLCECSMVMDPASDCLSSAEESETITLSFQMITSSHISCTRSKDSAGHEEVDSEYKELEEGIDVRDFGLFIFAKMEGTNTEEKLVMKTTNIASSTNPFMYIVGSPGSYTVSMVLKKEDLQSILGKDIDPNAIERVLFRVLILANCSSPGTDSQTKWSSITGLTFKDVIDELNNWEYAMNYLYNETEAKAGTDDVTKLYKNQKSNIPLFGTNVFYVSQEALYDSRVDRRIYLGDIYMLRALAKVRVIDNINNKDDDGYPKVIGATFIGSQDYAHQLPLNAESYVNGTQVHNPEISYPENTLSLENGHMFKLGVVPVSWTDIPEEQRKGDVRIGYVPEQKIGYINNNISAGAMPIFRITVEFYDHSTKDYDVDMKSFKGQTFEFGDNILRNHVYTLSVNEVKIDLDIKLAINNWRKINFEYEY